MGPLIGFIERQIMKPRKRLFVHRPAWATLAGAALAALLLVGLSPLAGGQDSDDVNALMRKVDKMWRGESSRARITMKVITRRYQRTMTMVTWSKGSEKSLVIIRAPKKDRGIATLKVDKNIWNYLPKIDRVTKIPPGMMMGSWMGSHFTNDDLVKESSFEGDYVSKISFKGRRDGRDIYEVTSLPRPDAPVVWGKVINIIDRKTLLPLGASYFDEDGEKTREITFEDPKLFAGRLVPARMVMKPLDKPGESTTIIYEELAFDIPLPRGLFSLRGLRSARGR